VKVKVVWRDLNAHKMTTLLEKVSGSADPWLQRLRPTLAKEAAYHRWCVRLGTGALPWTALAILIGGLILILVVMTGGGSCYTVKQEKCSFPFQYKGQQFTQCTTVDNKGKPWCSTRTDPQGIHMKGEWADCEDSCPVQCTTIGGPKSGQSCVFPFRWSGQVHRECVPGSNGGYWCATATDSLGVFQQGQWGECSNQCHKCEQDCDSECRTHSGQQCVFPFVYNGTQFHQCTRQDNKGRHWCATSTWANGSYVEGEWGDCLSSCTALE